MGIVISRALADELWPGDDPVGRRAELWNDPTRPGMVVGVVEDMREQGPEQGETLAVYFSYRRTGWSPIAFVIHASAAPLSLMPDVRAILGEIDPNLPASNVSTLDSLVQSSTASRRFTMTLLSVFAGLALVLALAGLYGVIAQSVGQRAKEFGVRVALGASSALILRLVMRRGMVPALIGIGVGLVGCLGLSRVLATLLYEVSPTDSVTYVGVGAILAVAAALACWVPARGALKMQPASVLRDE